MTFLYWCCCLWIFVSCFCGRRRGNRQGKDLGGVRAIWRVLLEFRPCKIPRMKIEKTKKKLIKLRNLCFPSFCSFLCVDPRFFICLVFKSLARTCCLNRPMLHQKCSSRHVAGCRWDCYKEFLQPPFKKTSSLICLIGLHRLFMGFLHVF